MIVLDTCAVIWDALDRKRLSNRAAAAIGRHAEELVICDISLWEIAMLMEKRRLLIDESAAGFLRLLLRARNFFVQEITPEIAELSAALQASVGADPADRLIAATSIVLNAPLLTADTRLLRAAEVRTVW